MFSRRQLIAVLSLAAATRIAQAATRTPTTPSATPIAPPLATPQPVTAPGPLARVLPIPQLLAFHAKVRPRLDAKLGAWVTQQATLLQARRTVDLPALRNNAFRTLLKAGATPEASSILATLAIIEAGLLCGCFESDYKDPAKVAEKSATWSVIGSVVAAVVVIVVAIVVAVVTFGAAQTVSAQTPEAIGRPKPGGLPIRIEDLLATFVVRVLATRKGRPVGGAPVSVRVHGHSERATASAVTGADGVATFTGMFPNFYVAAIESAPCGPASVQFVVQGDVPVVQVRVECA